MSSPNKRVFLAALRGLCADIARAVQAAEHTPGKARNR